MKLNDFPASDRDLFARFNSCFKDYEAALNNAKVIALPMLHAFTLYSAVQLFKHGRYNSKVDLLKNRLEKMAEPLIECVVDAVKGKGGVLSEALRKDYNLSNIYAKNNVANRKFKDYIKLYY